MKNENNVRALAAASLLRLEKDGRFSNIEIDSALEKNALSDADRALFTRLVYGVTERRITLDLIIAEYAKDGGKKIDPETRTALRLGLYQLLWADRIPDHAAVSSAVDAAPVRSRGFVNGILREFLRRGKKYTLPDRTDPAKYLSAAYSVSEDAVRVLIRSLGEEKTEEILGSVSVTPAVTLRINDAVLDPGRAAKLLGGKRCGAAVTVPSFDGRIRRGVDEGLWFAQDLASVMCTEALGAVPGDVVADVCAAPGGKTFSTALRMKNEGVIHAFDVHENKLSLIRRGAEKMELDIIRTACRDGRDPDPELARRCDKVLCDAPCSGLGVMAKKPELRYKTEKEICGLPKVQSRILAGAAEYVKPGGVLVYSTCTLNRAENEDVAEAFLASHGDFEPFDFELPPGKSSSGMLTILPSHGEMDLDGFFIARFRRTE